MTVHSLLSMTLNESMKNVLEDLLRNGYTCNFIKKNDYLYCYEKDMNFRSYELNITERFRYEDKSQPSNNSVLYAIESTEYGLKGFLVN
ncbi:MAG TPA: hypothetical protein PLC48_00525 [Ferruginibacter sp.]|nr:hypothetical protein [Ferruginibacter sp.]